MSAATIGTTSMRFERELSGLHSIQESRVITRLILDHVGVSKLDQLTSPDLELKNDQLIQLDQMMAELKIGKPVQYVIGQVEFQGMNFAVNSSVLIPRPETEELVALVLASKVNASSMLDIGTGSGVIACSLKQAYPEAIVSAVDVNEEALKLASSNALANGLDVKFSIADVLDEHAVLPDALLVVSNPPYIPIIDRDDLDTTVSHFEPALALFSTEPLQFYSAIAKRYAGATAVDVFVECHCLYAFQVRELFLAAGYTSARLLPDMAGLPRFVHASI